MFLIRKTSPISEFRARDPTQYPSEPTMNPSGKKKNISSPPGPRGPPSGTSPPSVGGHNGQLRRAPQPEKLPCHLDRVQKNPTDHPPHPPRWTRATEKLAWSDIATSCDRKFDIVRDTTVSLTLARFRVDPPGMNLGVGPKDRVTPCRPGAEGSGLHFLVCRPSEAPVGGIIAVIGFLAACSRDHMPDVATLALRQAGTACADPWNCHRR